LLPEYENSWRDRFRQEIDMGMRLDHRAFKVKIGRGHKWMPWEAGYARDKGVLEVISRHAGPEVIIGVDSNNGYTLEKAKQLLLDMPDYNFAFMEEMFPEFLDRCLEFKDFIKAHGWKILVADGESGRAIEFYKPFIEAQAIDICQSDMRQFGIDGIMTIAALCREKDILMSPHNWGSLMGYYMQLHIGRAISNFYTIAGVDSVATMLASFDGGGNILSRVEPLTTSAFPVAARLRDVRLTQSGNLRVLGDTGLNGTRALVAAELDTAGNEQTPQVRRINAGNLSHLFCCQ